MLRLIDPLVLKVSSVVFVLLLIFVNTGCSSSTKNVVPSLQKKSLNSDGGQSVSQNTRQMSAKNVSEQEKKQYREALKLMKKGDYASAKKIFDSIRDKYPSLSGPNINLGIIALKQNDYAQAEKYFKTARDSKPDSAEIYNYLGVAYRQQGNFKAAAKAYKKALALDDSMAKIYLNLGILNDLYLRNYLEAQQNYKTYLQFDPTNKKVKTWLQDLNNRIRASAK